MHTLYKHYDKDGIPLYIGISNEFYYRTKQHEKKSCWWSLVATIKIEHFSTRAELERAEQLAIAKEIPIYNTTYSKSIVQAKKTATRWHDGIRPRRTIHTNYSEP